MTTVAFDGKTIACDSQISGGLGDSMYKELSIKGKIIDTVAGPALVIAVGLVSDYEEALGLIAEGKNPKLTETESELLLVKDGVVYNLLPSSTPKAGQPIKRVPARAHPVNCKAAWGSGNTYAYTVLRLGGDAAQAVAAGVAIDLYSGGEVHAWDVATLNKLRVSQKTPIIK